MRNTIIVSCLVLSTILGAVAILSHHFTLQSVIFCVGLVWTIANVILSGAWQRSYWKARDIPLSKIYSDVKRGQDPGLPQRGMIERVVNTGAFILSVLFMGLYFV